MKAILFISLAGICNAVMDVLFTRFGRSVFRSLNWYWWNPEFSWTNKWKAPGKEKFLFSSTILVFITDGWHLFKALMIAFFILSVVSYSPMVNLWVDAVILYCTFTGTFTLFYDYILKL